MNRRLILPALGLCFSLARAQPPMLPAQPATWGEPFAGTSSDARSIHGFVGEYRWLSNFYPCPVAFGGLKYGSAEAVYQSCKFPPAERAAFTQLAADAAKKLAHSRKVDEVWWATQEDQVMREAVWAKFSQNPDLAARLLATGDKYLEETNWWDDTYWGVHEGKGKNMLGRILMEVRARLRNGHP
jgi:ribA/ribD-fused uncharacterized protein